jgi:hypothetical protein
MHRLAMIAAVGVCVLVAGASMAQASPTLITGCGQSVTTSAVLTQNLVCAGDGIVVGASGITIDLQGFVVRGDRGAGDYGIDDTGGWDRVAVKNGVVRNFDFGVLAPSRANRLAISNLVTAGNTQVGVFVAGGLASVTSSTASGNGSYGIYTSGTWTAITSSTVFGNGSDGIALHGDLGNVMLSTASGNLERGIVIVGANVLVKASSAFGNGTAGIFVAGDAAAVRGNFADGNGYYAFASDLVGPGILVTGWATNGPVGTNTARGNDDPAECDPASLC